MMIKYTKINIETICKNGSERYGAKAICNYSMDDKLWIEVSQYGKTKLEAENKLISFLSGNGKYTIEQT